MKVFFNVLSFLYTQLEGVWLFRVIRDLFKNPKVLFLVIIIALLAGNQIRMSYNSFSTMYDELNNPDEDAAAEDEPGLEFKQIDDNLYTLTGPV